MIAEALAGSVDNVGVTLNWAVIVAALSILAAAGALYLLFRKGTRSAPWENRGVLGHLNRPFTLFDTTGPAS